eukprot:TRINITY_DN9705_c0_g1_i5.p1 TRINITY_DN9705_c0_g1~~TRINITY_DN9705_c0_g1_i5.p1  ORF type:complete len:448 (+),score=83.14 TRINITY_DN9705_c0_g1_i5:195-1538(+)
MCIRDRYQRRVRGLHPRKMWAQIAGTQPPLDPVSNGAHQEPKADPRMEPVTALEKNLEAECLDEEVADGEEPDEPEVHDGDQEPHQRGEAKEVLVIDTGGIVKGAHLQNLGDKFITIPDVLREVRDKKSRAWLDALPYQLELREPSDEAWDAVSAFAAKTGDLRALSRVDLRVLALSWMMEKECCGGVEHLKTEPPKHGSKVITQSSRAQVAPPGWHERSSNKKPAGSSKPSDGWGNSWLRPGEEDTDAELMVQETTDNGPASQVLQEGMVWEDCEDAQLGWLGPQNIDRAAASMHGEEPLLKTGDIVACVTTDFAMQNVLLQMGIKVLSVDGMVIKRARCYILKCEACFKETTELMREFCPSCGNHTLYKVSVQSSANGLTQMEFRRSKKNTTRGTRYSIPLPKGGRYNTCLLYTSDAADEEDSVDLGGRRIIKKKKKKRMSRRIV